MFNAVQQTRRWQQYFATRRDAALRARPTPQEHCRGPCHHRARLRLQGHPADSLAEPSTRHVVGPRLCKRRAITSPGGLLHPWRRGGGRDELRLGWACAQGGADFVKICLTGGPTRGTNPRRAQYTQARQSGGTSAPAGQARRRPRAGHRGHLLAAEAAWTPWSTAPGFASDTATITSKLVRPRSGQGATLGITVVAGIRAGHRGEAARTPSWPESRETHLAVSSYRRADADHDDLTRARGATHLFGNTRGRAVSQPSDMSPVEQ